MTRVICRNSVKITDARHEKLKDAIAKEYGVEWYRIVSKSRYPDLVEARRCYYSILRNVFYYKLEEIGKETNQDHSTVFASLKSHDKYIAVYKSERNRYNTIKTLMLQEESKSELNERILVLKNERKILNVKIDELYLKVNRIEKELIINNQ